MSDRVSDWVRSCVCVCMRACVFGCMLACAAAPIVGPTTDPRTVARACVRACVRALVGWLVGHCRAGFERRVDGANVRVSAALLAAVWSRNPCVCSCPRVAFPVPPGPGTGFGGFVRREQPNTSPAGGWRRGRFLPISGRAVLRRLNVGGVRFNTAAPSCSTARTHSFNRK